MRIRRPRGISVPQLMVVTAVGILAGVYIWQPLILKFKAEPKNKSIGVADDSVPPAASPK